MFNYFTYYKSPTIDKNPTIEQLLNDMWEGTNTVHFHKYTETETIIPRRTPVAQQLHNHSASDINKTLIALRTQFPKDLSYTKFVIPKQSGGVRELNAPNDELKEYQSQIVYFLKDVCKLCLHNAAFAYVNNRSTQDAIIKHQENHSKYFLKIDLRHFFPSCSFDFVRTQLLKNYTYKAILQFIFQTAPEQDPFITQVLPYAFLKDELPQGSPASPYLSNLTMIPYDYHIEQHYAPGNFIYTRYADDILISHQNSFNPDKIVKFLETEVFFDTPLKINHDKIRFGTNAGRNWNLGLMLNKDNTITIGHRRKREIKSLLNNFFCNHLQIPPKSWSKEEIQIFDGQLAYFTSIEPEYAKYLIRKYENLYHQDYRQMVKELLNN